MSGSCPAAGVQSPGGVEQSLVRSAIWSATGSGSVGSGGSGPDRSDADARDECPVGHRVDVRCPLRGEKPTVRWQLGRAVDIGDVGERRKLVDLSVDIHLVPSTSAQLLVPSHSTAPGRRSASRMSRGSTRSARIQRWTGGSGLVRNTTSAMSPSVPSEPTMSLGRLKPLTFFTTGPPPVTISPSADTYRTCKTASRPTRGRVGRAGSLQQRLPRRRCRPGRAVPRSGRQRRAFHGVRRRSCRRGR